jgi:4-amino-4-deoxy-L-arabinose transferase-like glycosyltransferase
LGSFSQHPSRFWFAGAALLAVGVAMRVYNAFAYDLLWGFDARENWRYIARLTRSWALPAPNADWSTSHPPLFYYLDAAILRLLQPTGDLRVVLLRIAGTLEGLAIVFLAVLLVRRLAPGDDRRALIAGALLLFLPVHIYMSAMLSEELLVSAFISAVVVGLCLELHAPRPGRALGRAAALGVFAGLAWLTKLTGALVVAAAAAAYLLDGWRRQEPARGASRAAILVGVALCVGGWFYARNWIEYGYLYPYGLAVHQEMFTMPPGTRSLLDYLSFPWATFLDPQVIEPSLLHSVWGTTYTTLWFDGHRHFLPRELASVNAAGTLTLSLALLPTLAFALGAARGLRRSIQRPGGPDSLLLGLVVLTLLGYVLFTWRNPWFAVLKGSFLLGLCVPFAFYASEVLSGWTRKKGLASRATWVLLAALMVAVVLSFTHLEIFWSNDHMRQPGTTWWKLRVTP